MFVWPLITTMGDDNCIWCHTVVRPRQEAIECDVCSKWQHRKCGNIGITRAVYRQMVKDRQVINWTCSDCQQPNLPEEPMQADDEDDSIHASFNVELPFDIPSDVEEDNIADDSVYDDDEDVPAGPVTYTVIDNATQRGKPKLVDNIGYSYTLKREKNGARTWWCSVRNKTTHCGVIVHDKDGVFIPPSIQHNHTAVPGTLTATKIKVTVKQRGLQQLYVPARTIVEDVMSEMVDLREPEASRPNPDYLTRAVNRERQGLRPDDPTDLTFELDLDYLPDNFFRDDIHYDGQRHIIFSSNRQLSELAKAKTWYIDGTFKIVRKPFAQLLSIHSFIKSDSDIKQLPLVFVLMSRRRKKDYKKVYIINIAKKSKATCLVFSLMRQLSNILDN